MWWRLFWWIITTALTDLLTKSPPNATPAGVGDFGIPTATEGRVVPIVLGGNIRINAPNCIWYGDYAAIERTQSTGVIIKSDVTIGYTYELALQYALFKGRCKGITKVWIGDELVFDHIADNGGVPGTVIDIDRDDLFGGKDSGGGFIGRLRLFDGAEDQAQSSFLASRITEGLPAYRGTSYILVTDISETKGAEIGESPNLRYINVEVQVFDTVANGGLGDVLALNNDHHFIGDDANPVSVAYDLFINDRWGRALPPSDIDLPSFQAAAEICWTEGIGFSALIDEFTNTGQVQDWIEQHVDGYIGPNATTGKFEIKLARQNYVLANQYQANDSNVVGVPTWNKGDWTQTFNRVRMRFADRAKGWDETHAVANAPSNRIIQGRLVSQEVRYTGVHTGTVANKIVAREKKNLSRPARSGTVELNRTGWALRPGDVFSFTSTAVDETELPVRITKVEIGDPINNTMVCEVVEDIFDNETPNVADPPASDFVLPVQSVDPLLAADQIAVEAPFMMIRQDPLAPNVPGRLMTLARLNTGSPTDYEITVRDPGGSGSYVSSTFITGGYMTAGLLRNAEVGTLSGNGAKTLQIDPIAGSLDGLIGGQSPGIGNMTGVAVIAPGTANEEWVVFSSIVDDLSGIRLEGVYRGALDTTMKAHSASERIWFIYTGGFGLTAQQFGTGASIDVKLLPGSPTDRVLEGDATAITPVTFQSTLARYYGPLLPSQLVIDSADFNTEGDLDNVLLVGAGPAVELGCPVAPRLRDWRVQDPLTQVQGAGLYTDVWGQDAHQISFWLYDLDKTPTPTRGNAVWSELNVPCTYVSDGAVRILKEDLRTYFETNEKNDFNARIEVETSHIPGVSQPRIVSRDVLLHDFLIGGVYIVKFADVYFQLAGDGANGSRAPKDISANNWPLLVQGEDCYISTTASVFGGESCHFGKTNGVVFPGNTASGILVNDPNPPDLRFKDWTVEFRMRFDITTANTDYYICGQADTVLNWRISYYGGTVNRFRFQWSTIGSAGLVTTRDISYTGDFNAASNTWYAITISWKEDGAGNGEFFCFVDGVRLPSTGIQANPIYNASISKFEVGILNTSRGYSSGAASAGFSGYLEEFRFIPGLATTLVDYTVPVAALDAPLQEVLTHQSDWNGAPGESSGNALAQDFWNRTWSWSGASHVFIDGAVSKFGDGSLSLDGDDAVQTAISLGSGYAEQNMVDQDFTMEAFCRFRALPSAKTGGNGMSIFGAGWPQNNSGKFFFGFDENDDLIYGWHKLGQGGEGLQKEGISSDLGTLAINTWYHVAASRNGRRLEMYFDGTRVFDDPDFFDAAAITNNNYGLMIGRAYYTNSVQDSRRCWNGWLDETRITKYIGRYTGASITVPTTPNPIPAIEAPADPAPSWNDLTYLCHFEEDTAADPLWPSVNAKLEFEGTDAATTTTDESRLGSTWTFNGSAQIDTAQFAIGTSSLLLNGSTDWIETPDVSDFDIGADNFTMEAFIRFNGSPAGFNTIASKWDTGSNQRGWQWYYDTASSAMRFQYSTTGSGTTTLTGPTWSPAADTWYHVALMRKNSRLYYFVDGVNNAGDDAFTQTIFANTTPVKIGASTTAGVEANFFNGWIDQFRFTVGADAGRYNVLGYVTPTAALPTRFGGLLYKDEGPLNQEPTLQGTGPLILSTAQSKFGNMSLLLDGVDQGLILPTEANYELLALDFTIDLWVYFNALPSAGNGMSFVSKWDNDQSDKQYDFAYETDNGLVFNYTTDGLNVGTKSAAWTPSTATWYHVAVCRKDGYLRLFVDGTQLGDKFANHVTYRNDTETARIGHRYGSTTSTRFFDGHMDEVRIMVGRAMFLESFTPEADIYDFHLVNFQLAGDRSFWKSAKPRNIAVNGAAITTISSAVVMTSSEATKFPSPLPEVLGGGYSDAYKQWSQSNNYARTDNGQEANNLYNGDFTIEGWFYFSLISTFATVLTQYDATGNNRGFILRYDSTLDELQFYWYLDGINAKKAFVASIIPPLTTWTHWAVTREGSTLRIFIDGVLQTLDGTSATFVDANEEIYSVGSLYTVGQLDGTNPSNNYGLNGFAQDIRVMRGKAKYTATFTPPGPLPRL